MACFAGRGKRPPGRAAGVVIIALLGLGGYGAYALRHEAMTVIESFPEAAAKVRTKIQEARQSSNGAAGPFNWRF